MAKLPSPRTGVPVKVKDRPLRFSYWPMYKGTRRYGLQSSVFATNAWAIVRNSVKERCPTAAQAEALAYVAQAEDFFRAGVSAQLWAAKPLLFYYSLMNLAKAYCLTVGHTATFDRAQHGIGEKLRSGGRELLDAYLEVFPSPSQRGGPNTFANFLDALSGNKLKARYEYDVVNLLPQIVAGHRLWCDASGKRERFISLERVDMMENENDKTIWLMLQVFADDLSRLGVSHKALLTESGLKGKWREVESGKDPISARKILRFEQINLRSYSHRPSDQIPPLIHGFRHSVWATVTSLPPYRKYYLYLCPDSERDDVLPQLLSIYAVIYYLGSITRYRPQHFDDVIEGKYGEQIQEILTNQPNQFLYLLASEFAHREVTRPAIV